MRITEIIPSLEVGGAERIVALCAMGLATLGHSLQVISLGASSGSWIEAELARAGIELRFLDKRPGLDLQILSPLRQALRASRPEIVHTHLHVLKYVLPALVPRRGTRVVHTLHNLAQREASGSDRRVQALAFRWGVVPVAIGVAVAESIREVYGIADATIVANGIDLAPCRPAPGDRASARAELGLAESTPTFLTAGRLGPQKDHRTLLAALADPRLAAHDVHLLIAGGGELQAELEGLARALRVDGRVRFLGIRSDVPRLMAAADAFVLSSRWEGNPLVVMEAMAAGRPVLATRVGCVPELVDEGAGLLVAAGDPPALAEGLVRLATNPTERAAMGERAAEIADARFGFERMAGDYGRLFGRLGA